MKENENRLQDVNKKFKVLSVKRKWRVSTNGLVQGVEGEEENVVDGLKGVLSCGNQIFCFLKKKIRGGNVNNRPELY